MEIKKIASSCIVLVHHYELPFLKLASGKNLEKLSKAFGFQRAEVSQDSSSGRISSLNLRNGIFRTGDENEIAIIRLEIEERKIVINTESNSDYSEEYYDNLVIIMKELADFPEESFLKPIIMTYESQIVAHLQFPISSLLSENYLDFVNSSVLTSVASEFADVKLSPVIIAFDIDFIVKDEYLSQHRIALARKQFSVQPAIGHSFDEQIYYSSAPVDTQIHLKLLEELEERMVA